MAALNGRCNDNDSNNYEHNNRINAQLPDSRRSNVVVRKRLEHVFRSYRQRQSLEGDHRCSLADLCGARMVVAAVDTICLLGYETMLLRDIQLRGQQIRVQDAETKRAYLLPTVCVSRVCPIINDTMMITVLNDDDK